ncbi:hypothetical protein J3E68DRAFT_393145 [Trichoderma sp. SZMC 28012]
MALFRSLCSVPVPLGAFLFRCNLATSVAFGAILLHVFALPLLRNPLACNVESIQSIPLRLECFRFEKPVLGASNARGFV